MYLFSAKYKNQIQSILIHKDLKVHEFLDALSYSLQLPDGVIVGFQDRTGLIITPSFIVANPNEIKNEPYEVMLKSQVPVGSQQYAGVYTSQNQQNLSSSQATTLLLDTSAQMNQGPIFNRQQQQQQQIPQNLLNNPSYIANSPSAYESAQHFQTPAFGGPIASQGANRPFQANQSVGSNDRTVLMGSGVGNNFPSSYSNSFNDVQTQLNHQNDIILFVNSLQTDVLLTENLKNKIISKARLRDSGIYGAYQLYLVDGDVESFKARIIHRALTPPSAEYLSSATTAQFNWGSSASRQSTSGGFRPQTRENSRMRGTLGQATSSFNPQPTFSAQNPLSQSHHLPPASNLSNPYNNLFSSPQQQQQQQQQHQNISNQDRYLPVVLELESKSMLDEQTASLLKTLILEENVEVFRVINSYLAKTISDRELGFKLSRLALQLSNYIERPQSPLPRKKNQLLNYVNSLARYHFNDPDDVQLLNKLIHEENEFILSCFDVFDSDKDHDNLIDSLHRILDKSKAMGLHANSLTASSFYNQNPWAVRQTNHHTPLQQTQQQNQINQSYSQSSIRQAQPYISKWEERGAPTTGNQSNNLSQSHFANQSNIAPRSTERPQGAQGSRRHANGGTNGVSSIRNGANQMAPPPTNFQNTTVHNVALIPNYFSSGEEEGPYFNNNSQHPLNHQHYYQGPGSRAHSRVGGGYAQRQNNPYSDNQMHQREYQYGVGYNHINHQQEYSDDLSRGGSHAMESNEKYQRGGIPRQNQQLQQQDKKKTNHRQGQAQSRHQEESENIGREDRDQREEEEDSESHPIINQKSRGGRSQAQKQQQQQQNNTSTAKSQSRKQQTKQADQTESQNAKAAKSQKKKNVQNPTSSDEDDSDRDSTTEKVDKKGKAPKNAKSQVLKSKSKKRKASSSCSSDDKSSQSSCSSNSSSSLSNSDDESDKSSSSRSRHKKQKDVKAKSKKQNDKSKQKSQAKSDKKKYQKKQKPLISQKEIDEILDDEEVEKILRQENMALLAVLLREQDQDLLTAFVKYREDDDSEYLISSIEKQTEDALSYLLMQNFSNEENAKISSLRSQRNDALRRAFKKFRKSLDTTKLINGIRKLLPQISVTVASKGVPQNVRGEKVVKMQSRKEKLESIFNMIYHADFSRVESVAKVIYRLFHQEQDPTLLSILEAYQKHNNYLDLKNQVEEYMREKVQGFESVIKEEPELPINIVEAINLLAIRGEMGYQDQQLLLELYEKGDKHLLSSWEAFKVIQKMDDLLDTLLVLCEVKKDEKNKQKQQQQQQQQLQKVNQVGVNQNVVQRTQVIDDNQQRRQIEGVGNSAQTVQAQSVSLFGGNKTLAASTPAPTAQDSQANRISLMGGSNLNNQAPIQNQQQISLFGGSSTQAASQYEQREQHKQQNESIDEKHSDQNLNIDHNPDDSDQDDFQSIIEYQHKILRKYTMRGLIKYSDAPIFHEMVDQKDYKMISIFEVFAVNRDEDDFLENLGLLAQIYLEQENEGSSIDQNEHNTTISEALDSDHKPEQVQPVQQQQPPVEEFPSRQDLEDPRIVAIHQFREKLTPEEHRWCIQSTKDGLKNLQVVIDVWKVTKDDMDLIHSLKKIYKLKSGVAIQ